MKIANIVLAVLFSVFALVQINDVDPLRWIIIYGSVAVLFAFAAFGYFRRYAILGFGAILLIEFIRLMPEFINWINMGSPTITGKMKAESPHVEYTREFLGLLICLLGVGFLYYQSIKTKIADAKSPPQS